MMKTMKSLVACFALGLSLLLVPQEAHAVEFNAYVCSVTFFPGPTIWGNTGAISFHVSTQIGCPTGAPTTLHRLCTSGRTAADCPRDTSYTYTSAALHAVMQILSQAALYQQRVTMETFTTCVGPNTTCVRAISFTR